MSQHLGDNPLLWMCSPGHTSMAIELWSLFVSAERRCCVQVEELFQAAQAKGLNSKAAAGKNLAVLDLKRATAIGVRMSRLG